MKINKKEFKKTRPKMIWHRLFNSAVYLTFLIVLLLAFPVTFIQYMVKGSDTIACTLAAYQEGIYLK